MKSEERIQARTLRKQGLSINEIYTKLGVAKSSVSLWVRDIELTQSQKENLSQKGHSFEVIEKRRAARLKNENLRKQKIINAAKSDIGGLEKRDLFLTGVMLYWAEGTKRPRGIVEIANGDPQVIKIAMKFFREICHVPEEKLRGHIHIHPHLSTERAEQYWSRVANLPRNQFIKTYNKPNKSSKNKRNDTLPYGTVSVYTCDTKLLLQIKGWIEGLAESLLLAKLP